MKLIEALQIANARHEGRPFQVLLACGCTPLHLETFVKAHLSLALPARNVQLRTGLYGDLAGTLEGARQPCDAVLVVLEWGDLDPRLAWRSAGRVNEQVIADAQARLNRLAEGITALADTMPLALSLPSLPLAPAFHTSSQELNRIESALWQMLYGFAASTRAVVLHPNHASLEGGHDLKTELRSGFPYSVAQADRLAAALARAVLPRAPKKGLITDLDETLWSGVLGDDGPEGVTWDLDHKTQFHALYQNLLNTLAEAGVLLAVASKNDAGLVDKALTRADLVVGRNHLFPIEAHWGPKAKSVERILEAWNVGADSVVFVDDNPLELEQVRTAFPTLECVEFHKDDAAWLRELGDSFAKREVRAEDKLRTASIRAGQAIRRAAADDASLDALLAGAEARVSFCWGKQPPDPRALELINKTNQFNLNGVRYTEADWMAYLAGAATQLAVVDYQDRFGKLGKIAVLAGRETAGRFELDVWVMSCRAFSRRIEHQCLRMLLERFESVLLRFEPTERNAPMQDFVAQMTAGNRTIARAEFHQRCPPLYHQAESHQMECTGV